jgi:tRNA(fMet)-specific endonuclease VapC
MLFMLDTNICIHLIQNQPPQVLARFKALNFGDVVMSAVTYAELRHGVERDVSMKSAAERALRDVQRLIPIIPFDADAAVRYGELTAASKTRRRDVLDRLIAAHAFALDLTLVTNNMADFKDFGGLKLENWVALVGS